MRPPTELPFFQALEEGGFRHSFFPISVSRPSVPAPSATERHNGDAAKELTRKRVEGLLFFVMPYVEGETLQARLKQEGPPSQRRGLGVRTPENRESQNRLIRPWPTIPGFTSGRIFITLARNQRTDEFE